jgi:arylsulfatase A-like enzyme
MYYSILRYWYGQSSDEELPQRAAKMIRRAYRDAVRSVDGFVETLSEAVDPHDPITVFHSDHGEALGEHGNFGHKQTLYEENLRVPLFVHNAGSSVRITEQMSLQSLPDLISDLLDVEKFDPRTHTKPFIISQTENTQKASVRTNDWKYISEGVEKGLYSLGDGNNEKKVTQKYPKVKALLSQIVERHDATQWEKEMIENLVTDLVSGGKQL